MLDKNCDALIVGSGISGLSYALYFLRKNPNLRITIISKSNEDETNTKYAQGGIAVVIDESIEAKQKHIQDTLATGAGLCDKEIVQMVVEKGYQRFNDLVKWGVNFDKDQYGKYDLHLEGGHTEKRIAHHKDTTGKEIERALLAYLTHTYNVNVLSYHVALDLTYKQQDNKPQCTGAWVLDTLRQKVFHINAKITLICSGGIGQVYEFTTNPLIATGDGIGLAYRAGVVITQMAFIQFHPTALYEKNRAQLLLLSEALRGKGGKLLNKQHHRFMFEYDTRGDLAPRDIVSQAIEIEKQKHQTEFVYLDMRHIPKEELIHSFPFIYASLAKRDIFMEKDLIPVTPAMHYLCGGIKVNEWAETSLSHLFSIGECSCTGLHGANRLASNSLLEAVVYANNASERCLQVLANHSKEVSKSPQVTISTAESTNEILQKIAAHRSSIQKWMSSYVAVVRSTNDLTILQEKITALLTEIQQEKKLYRPHLAWVELENICITALLIVNDSLTQKENRGTFYNKNLS